MDSIDPKETETLSLSWILHDLVEDPVTKELIGKVIARIQNQSGIRAVKIGDKIKFHKVIPSKDNCILEDKKRIFLNSVKEIQK